MAPYTSAAHVRIVLDQLWLNKLGSIKCVAHGEQHTNAIILSFYNNMIFNEDQQGYIAW